MSLQQLTYVSALSGVESLSYLGSSSNVNHAETNTQQQNLNATSTPPVADESVFAVALAGGAGTIDLTALKNGQGGTIAYAGKRVQFLKCQNSGSNALVVAGNYGLAFTVPPGTEVLFGTPSGSTAGLGQVIVASTANALALTGTGTQSSNWTIVVG